MGSLRETLWRQLDPEAWPHKGLSPLNWFLTILILISITIGIFATEPAFDRIFHDNILLAERLILGVFFIEYIARIWVSSLNPRFKGLKGTLGYITRPAMIADLIVLIPLFLTTPPVWTTIFRLLRLLRLIRLASFPHIHQAYAEFSEALGAKKFELALTSVIGVLLILTSSTILYLTERQVQPEVFGSIPRAIWWSIVTFTTVGYGDAVPVTAAGRIFTGIFAICGIGLVAMLTGVIASALSDAAQLHKENRKDDNTPPTS